jgi:hypothetical protein
MLPGQLDFFATAPSTSLVGLRVLHWGECRNCGSNHGTLGSSSGPHCASVICTNCGCHLAWLARESADFIKSVIDNFGRPTAPIVVRNKPPSH